ncbi:CBFA2T3 isoform 5, partial [Pan troglodytes]
GPEGPQLGKHGLVCQEAWSSERLVGQRLGAGRP